MGTSDNLMMPGLGLLGGVILLVIGLLKRYKAGRLAHYSRTPAGSLRAGEKQLITGKVRAPVLCVSPVSKTECAFFLETDERKTEDRSSSGRHWSHWETFNISARGGFYVDDGTGAALVFPSGGCLDLNKSAQTDTTDGVFSADGSATRKTERVILNGENATVIGTPFPLGELLTLLRGGAELQLPTEFINELTRIEKERGPNGVLCFFGPGAETVSDLSYEDYLSGTRSSSSLFLQLGGIITALCAAALAYAMRGGPAGGTGF